LKVRSRDGDNLGSVKALMVDKRTGQSTYAVLGLGGFLGLNKSFYPVPFSLLAYDLVDDCYIVTIDRRCWKAARVGRTTSRSSTKLMRTGFRAITALPPFNVT
jgi:hypothetical protein